MKILATADTHFKFDSGYWPTADVFIHAGDLMYDGQAPEWKDRLNSLKAVDAPIKLYVPGNHDYYPFHFEGLAASQLKRQAGVTMLRPHDPIYIMPNGMRLLSIPYVTNLPGWAYNVEENWLYEWLCEWLTEDVDIVVSHAPMHQVLDATSPLAPTSAERNHVGSVAMEMRFLELVRKPLIWISGHIHESYGHELYLGCHFYNVSRCDEHYKQVNAPVVIQL